MRRTVEEVRQPRLHLLEVLGAGEGVLRQVDAPALADHELVERVDQLLGVVAHRDVERDRDARHGEREQPRALCPAVLDHAEEAGASAGGEHLEKAPRRRRARALGQHALVLGEAAPAVALVPVAHEVERVEEGPGVDQRGLLLRQVLPVEAEVEGLHRERPEQRLGGLERHAQPGRLARVAHRRLVRLRPAPLHQDAAPHLAAGGEAVDPPHRHRPVVGSLLQRADVGVDVAHPLDSCQIHGEGTRRIGNSTSRMWPVSPMPPTVAQKSSRSRSGPHSSTRPDSDPHQQPRHVRAEAAVDVVILAVHVGRHHAAEGDELGAGGDGDEPAAREEEAVQLVERQPRLGPQHAGGRVEGQNSVGPHGGDDQRAAGRRQRRVAIAAPQPAKERHVGGVEQIVRLDLLAGGEEPAPTRQL